MHHAGLQRSGWFFSDAGVGHVGLHLRGRRVKYRDASGSVGRSEICLIVSGFFIGPSFPIGYRLGACSSSPHSVYPQDPSDRKSVV